VKRLLSMLNCNLVVHGRPGVHYEGIESVKKGSKECYASKTSHSRTDPVSHYAHQLDQSSILHSSDISLLRLLINKVVGDACTYACMHAYSVYVTPFIYQTTFPSLSSTSTS